MRSNKDALKLQFEGFLATPPLWEDSGPINIPQYLTQPVSLTEELKRDLLVPDTLILGKRMEIYFAFYVKNFTPETLLAKNLVIFRGKTTIGEIDFLLLDKEREEYSHVELVYKFYLFDPELKGELDPWIGPNRRDTLLKKLHRLQDHQFPLLHREESRGIAQTLQLPLERILSKVCFKANLFVPLNMLNRKFSRINNKCIQGFWVRFKDFKERDYGRYHFHTPKKPNWSMNPISCEEWYGFSDINIQLLPLLQDKRSPLVWMKITENDFQRFFIVWW